MASSARFFGSGSRALMAAAKGKVATSAAATVEKPIRGLMKPLPISPSLSKFLGATEASRSGTVKMIWEYIKSNNLQNPQNKREIFCDEKLKTIFEGKDKVGFTEVAKLLSKHFQKTA